MKIRLTLLSFLSLAAFAAPAARASENSLFMIPLPLAMGSDPAVVTKVPVIVGYALPEAAFTAIGQPYRPPLLSGHGETSDVNAASVAGIRVEGILIGKGAQPSVDYKVVLDYSKVPSQYQTETLLKAVVECVHEAADTAGPRNVVSITLTGLPQESPLHAVLAELVKAE